MKPLEPLSSERDLAGQAPSQVERLLREAPPEQVRAELDRLDALPLDGRAMAARSFAHGALALREGRLDEAYEALWRSADELAAAAEPEAAALARAEAWLAAIRRGPRKIYDQAIEALGEIAGVPGASARVRVVVTHYQGTALRYAGRAEATLRRLLDAFAASEGLFSERAQVLNSLGTLYVVLGAYGAAREVLEHAAEINHQIGDRVSEAISYGQLGSAALGRGEPMAARRYLQKQEWFASRVGDNFGQARALTLLADLAIDLGRPDDAIDLAGQARALAARVTPPLHMWVAYATRAVGRAKQELGEVTARAELMAAAAQFSKIGNQLGEALVGWDLARLDGAELPAGSEQASRVRWRQSAWAFGSLGLGARVAQVLADLRATVSDADEAQRLELAVAATAQSFSHLGSKQEVALVLRHPDTLAAIATRRIAGQRNLGRLAAQTVVQGGLFLAAVAAGAIGTGVRALPGRRSAAVLVGQLPGLALLAWDAHATASEVARDLSSMRVALGEDTRAVLCFCDSGRLTAVPFAGELGAELVGAEPGALYAHALADPPATLRRLGAVQWDGEAEALARMSGFCAVT